MKMSSHFTIDIFAMTHPYLGVISIHTIIIGTVPATMVSPFTSVAVTVQIRIYLFSMHFVDLVNYCT